MSVSTTIEFAGVWKRVQLFEPIGILGPASEQAKIVLWIQSKTGEFIDLRVDPEECKFNHATSKSFAGTGSYDTKLAHFTWNRAVDFRPVGPPDIGLMKFLSNNELQEDGVLPGDDYREIWTRIGHCNSSTDCVATLKLYDRIGYFLIVGDYFALTLSRPFQFTNDEAQSNEARLQTIYKSETILNDEDTKFLKQYVSVIGTTNNNWSILYAIDPEMIGKSILPGKCNHEYLSATLHALTWTISSGRLPNDLLPYQNN